jgi:hypothetical protein
VQACIAGSPQTIQAQLSTIQVTTYQVVAASSRHTAALHFQIQRIVRAGRVAVVAWHARGRDCVAWSTIHPQPGSVWATKPLTRSTTRRPCRTLALPPRRPYYPSHRDAITSSSATRATTIATTSSSNFMPSTRRRTAPTTARKGLLSGPDRQVSMRNSHSMPAP